MGRYRDIYSKELEDTRSCYGVKPLLEEARSLRACRAFASFFDLFRHKDSQCIGMQEIIQYSEIIGGDSEGFGMDLNGIHEGFEL